MLPKIQYDVAQFCRTISKDIPGPWWLQRLIGFSAPEFLWLKALKKCEELEAFTGVTRCLNNLGSLYCDHELFRQAEHMRRRELEWRERTNYALAGPTADVLISLADILRAQGKMDEVEGLYRRALSLLDEAWGGGESVLRLTYRAVSRLVVLLREQKRYEEVEPLLRRQETLKAMIQAMLFVPRRKQLLSPLEP